MKKRVISVCKWPVAVVIGVFGLFVTELYGQIFGGVVFDPTQSAHAIQQIQQEIQQLAILRNNLQTLLHECAQIQANARFFTNKKTWQGIGNQIVRNWTPNLYGETASWNPAILYGTGALPAWQNATLALQRNRYLTGLPVGNSRDLAYVSAVETFDGAGPTALQTLGDARVQQTRMAAAIAQLQTDAADGSASTNSEVQQLNLLTAGAVQSLQMQQTTNNVITSLLEQQTLANKIQRDNLVDHLNFLNQVDQYMVSEGPFWGGAAASISNYRSQ